MGLEGALGSGHTLVGLGLGSLDVGNGLPEALVLEGLVGLEGSTEAGGLLEEGIVSVHAVLGHLVAHALELGGSGRNNRTDPVVGVAAELGVLGIGLGNQLGALLQGIGRNVGHLVVESVHGLVEGLAGSLGVGSDVRGVGSDVLVGPLDLGVGHLREGGKVALLGQHSKLECLGSLTLVTAHDPAGRGGAGHGGGIRRFS